MSEPILEISGLRLAIKTDEGLATVLDHIDFAVDRGRILGLVGEPVAGNRPSSAPSSASSRRAPKSRLESSASMARICLD